LKLIEVERVEDLLDCFLLGDGRLAEFLGSGQALNTDDFPYLEYIAARSAIGSSRQGLLPPIYSQFLRCREDVFSYVTNTPAVWLPAIHQSWASAELVLRARLAELSEPADPKEIRQTLEAALQLDPRNNVARNLLQKYLDAPQPTTK
jgi:hypothetical protein